MVDWFRLDAPGLALLRPRSVSVAAEQLVDPRTAHTREPLDLALRDASLNCLREQLGDRLELLAVLVARRATAFAVLSQLRPQALGIVSHRRRVYGGRARLSVW
jgi:hypothetical protein